MKTFFRVFTSKILIMACLFNYGFSGQSEQFYTKEHLVIDLYTATEWMRCSVGQRWNGETCYGKIISLNHDQMDEVINIATQQLGDGWRLPTRKELESLVCKDCGIPKIDKDVFPNTDPVPYWTGEQNKYAKKHYWSVNFYTGHTYGRFFPYQNLAVRLVRDR
tara:strand:+ start:2362 stop:2850 length:489 start_codon:yes stop_codon:yes gene_type:complete